MAVTRIVLAFALFVGFVASQTPTKPIWPTEFDVVFGLSAPATSSYDAIVNSTAHFYYNYDEIQASLIVYDQGCLPGIFPGSHKTPCSFYFNPSGAYIYLPNVSDTCCLLFPRVGSVPPNFLAGFNYSGFEQLAFDYYGVPWHTNLWLGGDFMYWTNATDGHDIQFVDGGFVLWNFAGFNVQHQDVSIFDLPSASCNQTCKIPSFGKSTLKNGFFDPFYRLSLWYHNYL